MASTSKQQTLVLKLGGQCLATPEKIISSAQKIKQQYLEGKKIIVVVSAMGSQTDELLKLSNTVSQSPNPRELDMLLSAGERISMSLMSLALNEIGVPAISFTGSQAGIMTTGKHSHATIEAIKPIRVDEELSKNKVVVIAGFQGVNPETKEITTLGRGGTDTTAVAFAAHYDADCIILKSVPGVFEADPHLLPQAGQLTSITLEQFEEMAFWGAKIIHLNAVEMAKRLRKDFTIAYVNDWNTHTKVFANSSDKEVEAKPIAISCHKDLIEISVPLSKKLQLSKFLSDEKNHLPELSILRVKDDTDSSKTLLKCHKEQQQGLIKTLKTALKSLTFESGLCSFTLTYTSRTDKIEELGFYRAQQSQVTLCKAEELQQKIIECYNIRISGGQGGTE